MMLEAAVMYFWQRSASPSLCPKAIFNAITFLRLFSSIPFVSALKALESGSIAMTKPFSLRSLAMGKEYLPICAPTSMKLNPGLIILSSNLLNTSCSYPVLPQLNPKHIRNTREYIENILNLYNHSKS